MKNILFIFLIFVVGCSDNMEKIRFISANDKIDYIRHEPFFDPEPANGNLIQLVYDIPYFSACGVFPPFHVFNQIMSDGGGDGGMSPGASWKPFKLDKENYDILLNTVRETNPKTLAGKSRYYHIKFIEAPEFNHIDDRWIWLEQTCNKYREWYHEQNRNIQNT